MAHEDAVSALNRFLDRTECVDDLRAEVDEIVDTVAEAHREGGTPTGMAASTGSPVSSSEPPRKTRLDSLGSQVKGLKSMVDRYAMPTECDEAIRNQIRTLKYEEKVERVRQELRPCIEANPTFVGDILILLGLHCAPIKGVGKTAGEFAVVCDINPGTDVSGLALKLEQDSVRFDIEHFGDCEGTIRVYI
jgi:hypothetical protein